MTLITKDNSRKYISYFLPEYRVYPEYDATPFTAGNSYCRLYLVEMYLGRILFDKRYPVVHAKIEYERGGKKTVVPYLAKPDYMQELSQKNLDRVIQYNYPLTELFPFNGGLVTLDARLLSMEASDVIKQFIKIIGRFSDLLVVPELSSVIKLAQPLYEGIEELTGSGYANLELGYRQSFEEVGNGGANSLKPGYFVAILAEEKDINYEQLCIVNDSLRLGSPGKGTAFIKDSKPVEKYSYMLFRLGKSKQQRWEKLPKINGLFQKAKKITAQRDYEYLKRYLLPTIEEEIWLSEDIAEGDRQNMIIRIKDYLKKMGLQSYNNQDISLSTLMERPLPEMDTETEADLKALKDIW
ncbi:MAG: hypothetical protein F6K40_18200 [Okeania sp. SIO3I5]|uniref:hypothetical protein n=1 Tax=Okeania sp. SIO3I5 TaxID=2607805 RepID=UPI0013B97B6B|nr:hypothetical protein [Okeania sp. SIO3I5]NEQ38089.1 hypothetical protein [Okeania sp. SIO3I5]